LNSEANQIFRHEIKSWQANIVEEFTNNIQKLNYWSYQVRYIVFRIGHFL
jgi:hypothetical protein